MKVTRFMPALAVCCILFLSVPTPSVGDETGQDKSTEAEGEAQEVVIARADLRLQVPKDWEKRQPLSRIVEHEFAIPSAPGDKEKGRLTIMGAGGSIQQNIDRWIGQFQQPGGGSSREKAKIEKKTIAGLDVHVVDLAGTFADRRGPFAPAKNKANYRMLAAIIVTGDKGNYFIKMYGPQDTIQQAEKPFRQFLNSLSVD